MNNKIIVKAEDYFKKYGVWSLLFSWLPIIGDPLTLVAGYLKYLLDFLRACIFGKAARYFFIVQFFPVLRTREQSIFSAYFLMTYCRCFYRSIL